MECKNLKYLVYKLTRVIFLKKDTQLHCLMEATLLKRQVRQKVEDLTVTKKELLEEQAVAIWVN